jgi:high mobility group protein B2
MSFTVANEYVIAFLTAQVENGAINSSILDSWKDQEEEFKTLLEKDGKKKEKKDKNAPKGAKSAYILFCADERPKVKEEEPGMDAKKIASELGKRWKELKDDDEEKVKEYQKMAEEDKVRFQKEMENYVPGEVEETKEKKTRKKKDKNAPKGSKSAYIIFCTEERPQVKEDIPNISAKEVLAELGKRWKALKDEDKIKYQEMADEDKVRFKAEMENYVPGEVEDTKEKVKRKKDKNAPKGARSAYILFCADERDQIKEDMPDINAKDVLAELGKRWKEFKENGEKNGDDKYFEYQDMAEKDKVRFKNEMENYVPGEEVDVEKEKVKRKKDKNAPKGARSAYILFCADERAQVKEDMPEISAKDVLAELGKRWKALKDDDEDRYNEYQVMAEKDKVRFKKEMEAYVPEENDEEPKEKKTIKEGPKRSKTAYQLFCEEQKEEVKQEGFEGKDVIAELARRWKELESKDKEYFNELKGRAEILKKEFQEAHPVEEKEKKIKKVEKKTEKEVKKTVVATKVKGAKKKTNKEIVHEIMDSFDDDETITVRMIKKKLDVMEVVIDKNELKEIVNDYNDE